jgi:hypothetical protein
VAAEPGPNVGVVILRFRGGGLHDNHYDVEKHLQPWRCNRMRGSLPCDAHNPGKGGYVCRDCGWPRYKTQWNCPHCCITVPEGSCPRCQHDRKDFEEMYPSLRVINPGHVMAAPPSAFLADAYSPIQARWGRDDDERTVFDKEGWTQFRFSWDAGLTCHACGNVVWSAIMDTDDVSRGLCYFCANIPFPDFPWLFIGHSAALTKAHLRDKTPLGDIDGRADGEANKGVFIRVDVDGIKIVNLTRLAQPRDHHFDARDTPRAGYAS